MHKRIPIFAHRGASGYTIENTMHAFNLAKELGADGIEIDVQMTKDEEFIVFHDLNLSRLAGINKKISDCTLQEINHIRIGKRFWRLFKREEIPSLKQVIEWANENQMPLNIELKESILKNTKPLIDVIQKLELPVGSHFSSFHNELMKVVKMQRPDFQTAFIISKKFNWVDLQTMTYIDVVHASKKYYKEQYINHCVEANKNIRFYSIVGYEKFIKDPHPSVIGWITDYPNKVLKAQKMKK
ncbi:glycerophosphoryl diester phosphodiesterase [Lysinibacillus sp. PLM2]|nr:glycerophosphoryl diester phosphodiesterase [Lysinibacillus sp. PLM2]